MAKAENNIVTSDFSRKLANLIVCRNRIGKTFLSTVYESRRVEIISSTFWKAALFEKTVLTFPAKKALWGSAKKRQSVFNVAVIIYLNEPRHMDKVDV